MCASSTPMHTLSVSRAHTHGVLWVAACSSVNGHTCTRTYTHAHAYTHTHLHTQNGIVLVNTWYINDIKDERVGAGVVQVNIPWISFVHSSRTTAARMGGCLRPTPIYRHTHTISLYLSHSPKVSPRCRADPGTAHPGKRTPGDRCSGRSPHPQGIGTRNRLCFQESVTV